MVLCFRYECVCGIFPVTEDSGNFNTTSVGVSPSTGWVNYDSFSWQFQSLCCVSTLWFTLLSVAGPLLGEYIMMYSPPVSLRPSTGWVHNDSLSCQSQALYWVSTLWCTLLLSVSVPLLHEHIMTHVSLSSSTIEYIITHFPVIVCPSTGWLYYNSLPC